MDGERAAYLRRGGVDRCQNSPPTCLHGGRKRIMISHILDIVTSAAVLYVAAAGLLIVFGVMKIINFAHGGFLTVGGYCVVTVSNFCLDPLLANPASFLFGAVAGMAVER